MKSFFRWVVKNPLIANLLSVFFLVGGAGAYLTMPQEYLPPVNLKWLFVVLSYPGVSASDIERLIAQPTEKELEKVDYVSQFNSISSEGNVEFSLQFEDISSDEFERQYQETRQAIDRTELPDDVLDPFFIKIKSSNFIPLVQVVVSGDEYITYKQLRRYGEDLRDRLEDFGEVDRVFLFDNRERQVHIQVNPILAQQIGVTVEDIQQRIIVENSDIPSGTLKLGQSEVLVRSSGRFRSLDDIKNTIIIRDQQGNHVPLSQIATVLDTHAREETRSRLNGRRSIALGVTKKDVGSSLELLDRIGRLLDEMTPALPSGIQIELVNDTSVRVKNALVNLQTNAIAGGFLVVIVLWMFIGIRNSILTAIGIPIGFSLAFILLKMNGASVNENTLFGLVLVLGMVVDDAIVVIENVYRYVQMGWSRTDAVIEGTREVLSPVITSTLTTIAAFMPLVLLPGTIGEFLQVVPVTVSLTLLASLIECFIILPSHIVDFGGGATQQSPLSKNISRLTEIYETLIRKLLPGWRRYAIAIGIPFSILICAAIIFPHLRQSLFSSDPQSYFAIWLKLPEGTSLDETDRQTRLLETIVQQMPTEDSQNIERVLVNVGVQNTESRTFSRPNYAEIIVDVSDDIGIKSRLEKMVDYTRKKAALLGYTQEEVQVKIIENGPPKDYPLEAKIQGEDFEKLERIAKLLKNYLDDLPGLLNVGDDYIPGKGELTFTPKPGEAQRQGITASDIGRALRAALDGLPAGGYRNDDQELPIIVRYRPDWFEDSSRIGEISLRTPTGMFLHLDSVADLHRDIGLSEIKRRDFRRTITVFAEEIEAGAAARAASNLQEYFRHKIAPDFPGYSLNFGGQFEVFNETFSNIVLLFVFGAMCIFFILVVQFRSLIQPLIILMTIPFALAGAMVGLIANGYPLSITAIYGMVGLSGVIVNDSIVLISFANNAKSSGLETTTAVVEAATKRLRPILLTTVTTVGGVLPIALGLTGKSEVWSPLATIIVFGLTTATALMLLVIPCLFCVADDMRSFIRNGLGWERFEQRIKSE
ncbi:MAG: efflux RND transporter permease subunit [Candidatus Latescibacterota bacterium]|nr:efflux RND transporter permease subunit [Candidatus Latescibacterota bacterium]